MNVNARQQTGALLAQFGWNAVSAQVLRAGFRYWLLGAHAAVAYVDTGRAWVAAGPPIAAYSELLEVAQAFVAAARAAGRRAAFFAVEDRFLGAVPFRAHAIGRQPVWDPTCWPQTLAATPSLRAQVRRAQRKGVHVRELTPEQVCRHLPDLASLRSEWLRSRRLAPMRFLVDARLRSGVPRRIFVAELQGRVVGMASALAVPARGGYFVEHLWRGAASPNGTVELLMDVVMRTFADEAIHWATLGLAPFDGPVSPWVQALRGVSRPLYNFGGLAAFKAKLRPVRWDPIYLAHPQGSLALPAFYDVAVAFAGGHLLHYAARSVRHRVGAP